MDIGESNRLQYHFLSELAENKARALIFLIGGVRLRGFVLDHDLYTITFALGESVQLIYKHAVATIIPWSKEHGSWENKRQVEDYKR